MALEAVCWIISAVTLLHWHCANRRRTSFCTPVFVHGIRSLKFHHSAQTRIDRICWLLNSSSNHQIGRLAVQAGPLRGSPQIRACIGTAARRWPLCSFTDPPLPSGTSVRMPRSSRGAPSYVNQPTRAPAFRVGSVQAVAEPPSFAPSQFRPLCLNRVGPHTPLLVKHALLVLCGERCVTLEQLLA